tara:strand:- start:121 stop:1302 length:1182 start_codon:yes stop_codon:yes gene_type:complete
MNRRNLLKYSGLFGIGFVSSPEIIWSNAIDRSINRKNEFILKNNIMAEYGPPKMPKLSSLKARLHWNENPYGPNPNAIEKFNYYSSKGNFYSWDILKDFVKKIALKEGVKPENVMTGPGSSDLLEKVALVVFQNGGNVIAADPCYMSLINVVNSIGGSWKSVKLTSGYEHDLDKMESTIDSNTKLIYITNPNNPTATITNSKKLYDFCDSVSIKVPVFIDEAYLEISEGGLKNSMVDLVSRGRDVIITRTFSKIHGMAGLRLGYMIATEERLKKINEITRGGMGIAGPTIHAAIESLNDNSFLESSKEKLISNREFTVKELKSRNFYPMPSSTNFLIFELPERTNPNLFLGKMYGEKVSVKAMNFWNKKWCRVSIGTKENMEKFISAFDKAMI